WRSPPNFETRSDRGATGTPSLQRFTPTTAAPCRTLNDLRQRQIFGALRLPLRVNRVGLTKPSRLPVHLGERTFSGWRECLKGANKRHALRLAGPVQPGCYPTSTTLGGVTMPRSLTALGHRRLCARLLFDH